VFPVFVDPAVVNSTDRYRVQEMKFLASLAARDHEPGFLQHLQVLHDPEPGHLELPFELAQRLAVALAQQIQQEAARAVGERLEHLVIVDHGPDYR